MFYRKRPFSTFFTFFPFFSLFLLFSSLFLSSFSAFYASSASRKQNAITATDNQFVYSLNEDGNAIIVGYKGYDPSLTIPSSLDGKTVVAIEQTAFYANSIIQKVTISNGIRRIEKDAFAYCENLTEVHFAEDSCKFIGESAFEGCPLLSTLVLPENLCIIDDLAFLGCIRLGNVKMPSSLQKIGYHAFQDCENLVFDAALCPAAMDYAAENDIDLSYEESSSFLFLKLLLGVGIAFLLLLFGWFFFSKRRRLKKSSPSSSAALSGSPQKDQK